VIKPIQRLLLVSALVLLASGCAVRFVYNQLDWLVPWYLDDYIALEGPQKQLFESRLDAYLQWHRREQLPLYAEFLEDVAGRAKRGLKPSDIATIQRRTEELAQAMVIQLQPDMIELFAMASDKQVEKLFRKFAEDDARFRKEYLEVSAREQRRQRAKEALLYVERWTGSLRKEQRKMIDDWSQSYELMAEELLETRTAWQQEFRRILDMRQDRPAYEAAFKQLLANPTFGRSDALQQKYDRNEQAVIALYLQLDHSLSPDQRTRMVKKLRSYADDFRHLAKQQ
jgi:hypothetical protein